jgi:sugar phosphate isomerase/epimerase
VDGRLVTLSFNDGERVLLNTRPEEGEIDVELGGQRITGTPALVRLREGRDPVRIEARREPVPAGGRRFIPGLVSVTFRSLAPEEVVRLASSAGLELIEWGGDVHVPPGDLKRAREVATLCREAGIGIAAYGSYYRLGAADGRGEKAAYGRGEKAADKKAAGGNAEPEFGEVLETAAALGAPRIRVWAGEKGSAETSPEERKRIVREARSIAERAADRGISVCFEYHEDSLTDTGESARALLREIDHVKVKTYWQPPVGGGEEENAAALRGIAEKLEAIHVTQRSPEGRRRPLSEGRGEWQRYLDAAAENPGPAVPVMLEFLSEESPEQLREDAAVLRELIRDIG